jgi:hypothetical protein
VIPSTRLIDELALALDEREQSASLVVKPLLSCAIAGSSSDRPEHGGLVPLGRGGLGY